MSWSAGKDFISRPYFGKEETDIVVQQGEVAFFNCHVHNLANQTVIKPFVHTLFNLHVQCTQLGNHFIYKWYIPTTIC